MIELAAESSKTVLMKFEPLPPTPENKVTWVPFGAIKTPVSCESGENAALSETRDVSGLERAAEAWDGQCRVEHAGVIVCRGRDYLAGAAGRRKVLRTRNRAGRAHDRKHLAGRECACLHGPVERDAERARRAVGDQVVRAVATRHGGAQNLRPGHDQRQGVLIERRSEDARGALEREPGHRSGSGAA